MAKDSVKKLRVGFVGAGGIAGTHANNYQNMPDVEIVAASDVSEKGLKAFQEKYKVPQVFTDWKQMLKECELDAVSVCTPNFLHCEPTIGALNAGCHVLCEKPLAMSAAEGRRMLAAAKKNKKQLVIAFQFRFDGKTQALRRAYDEGFFGKVLYVRVKAIRRRGIPNWGVFGRKELQGGGPLIDIGVHALEMAHYAVGAPQPQSALGFTWTYLGNKPSNTACSWPNWDWKTYTVEDLAVGTIRTKNGPVFHLESAFVAHTDQEGMDFTIFGEKGGAQWSTTSLYHDHAGMMVNSTPAFVAKRDGFVHKMRHFVDVCQGKCKTEAPAEHGLMVQQMLDGIYASAKQGKEVKIK
ncbi:MAG: Gfo/Idh/MocA family oxidoreductase [Planctomycetes bacterium]|nr:Gfo/Idh/MocA family oxidoreductase [Planctomycetota bacterium]